jgi:hypothetical protein
LQQCRPLRLADLPHLALGVPPAAVLLDELAVLEGIALDAAAGAAVLVKWRLRRSTGRSGASPR